MKGFASNQGEFLDRKKQRFDMTDSMEHGDFEAIQAETDLNPCFTQAFKILNQRRNHFLLTMDEGMIEKIEGSSSDEEDEQQSEVHELIHKSQSMSNVLYQGADLDKSEVSFNADDSRVQMNKTDSQTHGILDQS